MLNKLIRFSLAQRALVLAVALVLLVLGIFFLGLAFVGTVLPLIPTTGPVLLAAEEPEPRTEWRKITLDGKNLANSLKGDPAKLRFEVDGVKFKPFFDTYDRNSVYLDVSFE